MAKSDTSPGSAAATSPKGIAEWKKILKMLVRTIEKEDDGHMSVETYDAASRAIAALREIRSTVSRSSVGVGGSSSGHPPLVQPQTPPVVPEYFLCPISSELMTDPVIVASGQTYDRAFIQDWLNSGKRTCPRTKQILSNTVLIPNLLVRTMISQWCIEHGIAFPPFEDELKVEEGLVTTKERNQLKDLLDRMSASSSNSEKKKAVMDFRQLTKRNFTFRAVITENPDALLQFFSVLADSELNDDPEVHENAVTTIFNLSVHESNKKIIGDNPLAIMFLINALGGATMDTRANAAAALFSLAALDSNKIKIGEMGAMKPLLELLQSGSPSAKKDAGSAIFNLCLMQENKTIALRDGAVNILLQVIRNQSLVDESVAILALLSSDNEVIDEIAETDGMGCLLNVIKENSSPRSKENAIVVLYSICMFNRTKLRELGYENIDGCISQLAQNGTPRACRKAAGIVDKWKKTMHSTTQHNSC